MPSNWSDETDKYIDCGRGDGVAIELLSIKMATMLFDCFKIVSFFLLITSFADRHVAVETYRTSSSSTTV